MQGSTQPTGEKNNVIIVPDTKPLPSRPVTPVAQLPENKLVDVTPPATPKNPPIKANVTRSCIIRLEILTEADIFRHVHVHKNQPTSSQTAVKPVSVETVETGYRTRSSLCLKPSRSNRLPWAVSTDVTYTN